MTFAYPAIWITAFWFLVYPYDFFFSSLIFPALEAAIFILMFVGYHIGRLLPFYSIIDARLQRN